MGGRLAWGRLLLQLMVTLLPNDSRLSCGALVKDQLPPHAPPASSACEAALLGFAGRADYFQLRAMSRQRIAQDVQRRFERKTCSPPPGRVHRARAAHRHPRESAPGTQRTGIQAEYHLRHYFAGHRVSDQQGVLEVS